MQHKPNAVKASLKLRKVAIQGAYVGGQLPTLARLAVHWGLSRVHGEVGFKAIAGLTARSLLRRPFNQLELDYFQSVIQQNELSEWALPISFFRLPDSVERRVFHCLSLEKHHLARMELVKTYLPPAENILDIGGAVDIHPEGALLAMGYPHRPRSITIVDLPDEEREFAKRGRRPINMTTASGTHVSYEFTNMTRLTPFQDSSFDLVWSGQSIEHLTQKEVDLICAQVFRVLRPGGYFCLDTPNRLVTQLISKNYLHPDHKFEYSPDQLTAKLEKAGFTTLDRLAVTPLPFSRDLGRVSKLEILKEARVGTNSLDGFSFYLKCQKPEV